jgi:N6-L-threonylcarbamoyladenine synthase
VGVVKARQLAAAHALPFVPVHHMEAHALVARMGTGDPSTSGPWLAPAFPFVCLLVSGGHNLLVLVEGVGIYTQLGTTVDDALGARVESVTARR